MIKKVFIMSIDDNANKMRNFGILEDLDWNHYEQVNNKPKDELLSDCFIRNFNLIRRYAHSDNQLFITKFKKKLIPKYLQELHDYHQAQILKNRQLYYARRKHSQDLSPLGKKNRQSLPELLKTTELLKNTEILKTTENLKTTPFIKTSLNSQNPTQSDQILEPTDSQKSFPILFNEKPLLKKNSPIYNINNLSRTHMEKLNPSQKVICSPLFLNSPKKRIAELQKISKEKLSKSYANIYTDSLNFCQNFLFKNTFDEIGSKREMRDSTEGLNEIFNIKRTLADEKSIEKKMMNVLKKRKSAKTLKMKIFSKYLNSTTVKADAEIKEKVPEKENLIYKLSFNELNKEQRQPYIKQKIAELTLKGKLLMATNNNHRATTSCVLDQSQYPMRETFESLDEIIDAPTVPCRKNILNITQSKLVLPKFS